MGLLLYNRRLLQRFHERNILFFMVYLQDKEKRMLQLETRYQARTFM